MKKLLLFISALFFATAVFCEPIFVGSENKKDYWYDSEVEITYCCQKSNLPYEVLKGTVENYFITVQRFFGDNDEMSLKEAYEDPNPEYEFKLVLDMLKKGYNFVMLNIPPLYLDDEIFTAVAITDGKTLKVYWLNFNR